MNWFMEYNSVSFQSPCCSKCVSAVCSDTPLEMDTTCKIILQAVSTRLSPCRYIKSFIFYTVVSHSSATHDRHCACISQLQFIHSFNEFKFVSLKRGDRVQREIGNMQVCVNTRLVYHYFLLWDPTEHLHKCLSCSEPQLNASTWPFLSDLWL